MRGDECHRHVKLVPCTRNKPMHNARNMSKAKKLEECLVKVKGFKLQRKDGTMLSDDENKYEGLYNELKASKLESGS